ncbi:probable serine/threonine-protein kinase PIX13 [Manihot esculenta]|uniref:probable serine/threonine-protein kinase PIX13 n=1 Tax=Manihot esculenta TaxID=3983 RepID=UPI001CC7DDCB|nr:probable serine/threonine-protein kinase PIX13 [Manihot esculenta]
MKRQFPYRQPSFFSFYTSTSMLCSATVSYSEAVKEENFTFLLEMDSSAVISFSSSELSAYTDGFSARNFLGNGGFGSVYLGTINGEQVAVKVSRRIDSKTRLQWQAEINYLANMMHQNIIKLIGYCNTPEKLYLVYPFMQHGNVKNKLLGTGD